jgi:hypothetical protein
MKYFDLLAHVVLFSGFVVGAVVFFTLRFSVRGQFATIAALSVFYLFWGLTYHLIKNDFSKRLAVEYILVALISLVVGVLIFLF